MSDLSGRSAIVSGAAGAIGGALVDALLAGGAQVLAFDVDPAVHQLETLTLRADVSQRADVERVVGEAGVQFGGVDLLVHAARQRSPTPIDAGWEESVAEFERIMGSNVRGPLLLSRACVPAIKAAGGGDIVFLSVADVLPARDRETNLAAYDVFNASQWALNGLTDAWAKRLAGHDIRVNGLCPQPGVAPEQVGRTLLALLESRRSGENIGIWEGADEDLLPPPPPAHRRISG